MEFLNNIWTLLTTESEFVTNIVMSPMNFIEAYIVFKIFTSVLNIKYKKWQAFTYVMVFSIFSIINLFYVPYPVNSYLNYIVLFLLIKFLFRLNFFKTILAIVVPIIAFGLVNSLIMNPFLKIFGLTLEETSITPTYQFIYLLFVYTILFILIIIFKHRDIFNIFRSNLDKGTKRVVIFNLIVGIFTLCIQALLTVYYVSVLPVVVTLFNFVLLLAYFAVSFYSLNKVIKLRKTTIELENAESYNNSLSILYDNVRGFKHDFDNIVNFIGGCIKSNDMEGLKKYYKDLEKDCVRVNNAQLLNPQVINNAGIYNLIVSKDKKATDLGIKINLEIFFDFNELHMPIYEFSKILGILLDNAIEASKECDEKEINLLFRESRKNNVQIISIENTYSNKDVDTDKIFKKGVSGKENHSGIGLWEVDKIVKQNNNIVLRTSKDDKFFKQQLEIYY